MLACARIGAVHSVVFGGFAPHELAKRIDDARPVMVVTAACGIEVPTRDPLQAAARPGARSSPRTRSHAASCWRGRSVRRRSPPGAISTGTPRSRASCPPPASRSRRPTRSTSSTPRAPPASPRASSATTAATRSRSTGRCTRSTASAPGEVYWAASDVGWVVGHSYIVYAPLLTGCTTDPLRGQARRHAGRGRVLARHRASTASTRCSPRRRRCARSRRRIPTGRLIARSRPVEPGERCSSPASAATRTRCVWAEARSSSVPVIDHWWQTETGWPVAANCRGLEPMPVKPGSASVPVPGYDVQVLDDAGTPKSPPARSATS